MNGRGRAALTVNTVVNAFERAEQAIKAHDRCLDVRMGKVIT